MAEASASAAQIDADDEPPALNALQENIARRGNNAYYYAHGHRNDAPAWDGDPSPMKLETTAAPPERRRCAITRYSWLDEDTKIRIYIPVDDERFQRPDAITLTWTEKSVVLAADLGDEVHTFAVPALYDTIVGASHRGEADENRRHAEEAPRQQIQMVRSEEVVPGVFPSRLQSLLTIVGLYCWSRYL